MEIKMSLTRSHIARFAAATTLAFLLGTALAAAQEKEPPRAKGNSTPKAVAADAPNARLAALIRYGGKIIRSKGVDSVTKNGTGVYCIKPTASSGIDPTTAIAIVSVEWYWTQFKNAMVQWGSQGTGCGQDKIGVYTLGDFNNDARYTLSNDVGFSIYVP
jgi:hypothetical protein